MSSRPPTFVSRSFHFHGALTRLPWSKLGLHLPSWPGRSTWHHRPCAKWHLLRPPREFFLARRRRRRAARAALGEASAMDALRGLEWLSRREPSVLERDDVARVMRGEATVRAHRQVAKQEGDVQAHTGPSELTRRMRVETQRTETWETVEELLQTHGLTEKVCTCFRPAILRLVTRIVERRRREGAPWKENMVLLCSAVLPLAPHTEE